VAAHHRQPGVAASAVTGSDAAGPLGLRVFDQASYAAGVRFELVDSGRGRYGRDMSLLLLLSACDLLRREAEVYDFCDPEIDTGAAACLPCEADGDCTLAGNPCYDTVACAHRDDLVAVPDLGCSKAIEHPWPDPAGCRCLDDRCTWSP
jgi:hypothetical protein